MMRLAVNISFPINPEDLHVYSNMIGMGNTTPAGVAQPATVYFYKHSMPLASALAIHRNKLLAEAFYLRGDIEKFGTGFFRIQSELKNSPELRFTVESLNGFMCSGLEDTAQVTHQDKHLTYNAIGYERVDDMQDTSKDTAQVRDLIMNVEGEMNREEIQKKLKLTHRENFRKFYLKPALDSGLIEMTIPGKPNSRHQKYRLTEKGRRVKNKE